MRGYRSGKRCVRRCVRVGGSVNENVKGYRRGKGCVRVWEW